MFCHMGLYTSDCIVLHGPYPRQLLTASVPIVVTWLESNPLLQPLFPFPLDFVVLGMSPFLMSSVTNCFLVY